MQAIILTDGKYILKSLAQPAPLAEELLIKVAYAGVNHVDLYQKQGRYPLPIQSVPGLEVSGEVAACGSDVKHFVPGDKVCALLSEGGFAQYVCVPASHALPVPGGLTLKEAAALPEACFTAWTNLVWQGNIMPGETVLVHGGASGVGSMAIQMARILGATVFATAGTDEKCAVCTQLGAQAIPYKREDFVQAVKEATAGKGVDIILDMVGGDYMSRNLASLAPGGRLCVIAFIKGAKTEVNLSPLLLNRLTVMGSTLRSRPASEKARIAQELHARIWPVMGLENGIKPLVSKVFPLAEAEKALALMQEGLNVGKILLKI